MKLSAEDNCRFKLLFKIANFSDKMFEKAKFNRLKISILKSITIDIEVLIKNELLRNKYTLADKSSMKYIERK